MALTDDDLRDDPWRRLFAAGVTFRTAPQALRERLLVPAGEEPALYGRLQRAGLGEALLLSTCDRVEVLGVAEDPPAAGDRVLAALAERAGLPPEAVAPLSLRHEGREAVRHLFAVAASLDSQVPGEPQVLGQVREAMRRAQATGAAGPLLDGVAAAACRAARRVRQETELGRHPVSLAAAAVRVARTLFGDLERTPLLLLGLGEMGEILAHDLRDAGLRRVAVLHPGDERARAAALRLQGQARPAAELEKALSETDIVIAALGAGRALLTRELMLRVARARRQRPILLLDVALPSDIGPGVETLEPVFLYGLADLERLASEGKASREGATAAAWRVLGEELAGLQRRRDERRAAPALVALRRHADALRQEIVAEGRLDAEAATALLLARLLHGPTEALRRAAAEGPGPQESLEAALLRLFPLDLEDT